MRVYNKCSYVSVQKNLTDEAQIGRVEKFVKKEETPYEVKKGNIELNEINFQYTISNNVIKLDLSNKSRALAGGESGAAIVAGKSGESLLWDMVNSNEMPSKRPPLSAKEKQVLRDWIDAGANWPIEVIDPAVYAHENSVGDIWVQRLTVSEYIATVKATFAVDIAAEAQKHLPPDLRADGFANTAYNLAVDLQHVEAYATLAEKIVNRLDVAAFARQFSRSNKLTDPNMRPLIAKMGRWVLRGPLSEHEVATYRGISTTVASAGGDFEDAVRFILQAMAQSPRFIYRVEEQQGDGRSYPVGPYELASRMSYIVWGSSPDRELLDAAAVQPVYLRNEIHWKKLSEQ